MKITLAQLNYHIGNFEGNLQKMLAAVEQAKNEGSDIVCFGEMATCGYPPRDFLEFRDFILHSMESVQKLAEAAQGIAIAVGSPSVNPVIEGKDLYNSAFFLFDGKIQHIAHKALLPTYDIFDEYRYFEPAKEFSTITYKGFKIALTICEDIWNVGNDNPLYTICPMDEMKGEQPDIMLNLSASPFSFDHAAARIATVKANVQKYGLPMFYVNHVGAQTEILFDGGSLVVSPDQQVYDEMPYFEECVRTYDLEEVIKGGVKNEQAKDKYKLIHDGIVTGIRNYFQKLGFKKAILGLSGGIDSALTAVLAVRALGKDNVRGVLMPSEFSTGHSVTDAKDLAENLGIQTDIIQIKDIFNTYENILQPLFEGKQTDVTEENIQARIRGMLLMALSNKFGNILLNTTNKSEFAVGYGTLYGDLCGGLSVLGDVYKTEVYKLVEYVNKDEMVIPLHSIIKPPSAELRPGQKDSDSLPEYDVLDPILFNYIEKRLGPLELVELGYDETLVKRILKLVNINEFKRHQSAPVIRVSNKAFGVGRRLPIVAKYLS
jgi:NAD+ synthase (glutamine-hydrolysing)